MCDGAGLFVFFSFKILDNMLNLGYHMRSCDFFAKAI